MTIENKHGIQMILQNAFEAGYSNAAAALSQIVQEKVNCNNFTYSHRALEKNFLTDTILVDPVHSRTLITTDVFGDVSGKSYLLLDQHEFEVLTRGISSGKDPLIDLKIEFIKELDNILSAAVITKLCNYLGLSMYGDIPKWVGPIESTIDDLILNDFNEKTANAYISSACFSFESQLKVRLFFVWVMDDKIMQAKDKTH